jgi:methionyl-tRNA formyltransferase
MKVIFFGTPLFAAHVLRYLLEHSVNIVAVVSKPDRPKGRSLVPVATPVKTVALTFNASIPIYQPEIVSSFEFAPVLESYRADLFIVVAYGELVKQHLLDMPKLGCINLHASLLPRYRGAAPIQSCIIHGETETGVTIMHMVKKMDAGDIIEQVTVPIGENTTFGELEQTLCEVGKKALLKVIHDFKRGHIPRIPQNHEQATFAHKIELEDCEIHWNRPALELHNLVRGVYPFPGAWCWITIRGEKKRLKVHRSQVIAHPNHQPGNLLSHPKEPLLVATANQALQLIDVQLEGKKAMPSIELLKGIPLNQIYFDI